MLQRAPEPPDETLPVAPGLTYASDALPGLRRRRAGKGFCYLDTEGARIGDETIKARIKALAIPPAWRDVWICPELTGHIQATGRDERGRKQYRYHPDWSAGQEARKFSGLVAFGQALPRLRARVDLDLRRRGVPRERVLATVVRLLDTGLIRVGNDRYLRENGSVGLTTLHARHLSLQGASLRLSFIGKSGKPWRVKLQDRRIANAIRSIQDLPGQRLFRYLDAGGQPHDVQSQDVNGYIRDATGPDFTSKHFRTWGASVRAALALAEVDLPASRRAQTRALNAVIDAVAQELHNTRAVCRQGYVHPAVIEAWQEGRLAPDLAALRRRLPRPLKGLDEGESLVLRWLRRQR